MRARAVTTEPVSACLHSIQTLLVASCALLELATSCTAILALSRFSDVALAACSMPTSVNGIKDCSFMWVWQRICNRTAGMQGKHVPWLAAALPSS